MDLQAQQALAQQQDLLREIRDELRITRNVTGAAVSGHGGAVAGSMTAARGMSFLKGQVAADQALLGQWQTMGWTNAYSHLYKSSMISDLSTVMGFTRAPQSMTQSEFSSIARDALMGRLSGAVGHLVAPGYTSTQQQVAAMLMENSPRFIRYGNAEAGVLGEGLSPHGSRRLAHAVTSLGFEKLGLSNEQYAQVAAVGLQTGQYNDVSSSQQFVARTRELGEAVSTLARTLHQAVPDVAQALGTLRSIGVSGVSNQAALMAHGGAAAAVSGLTFGEIMGVGHSVGTRALSMGMDAGAGVRLGIDNAAMLRQLSTSGALSANVIAAGGGAMNIAQTISAGQLGFANTAASFLARSGRSGNFYTDMMTGLSANASLDDMLALPGAMLAKPPTAAESERLLREQIESTVRFAGADPLSTRGSGMAFQMAMQAFGGDRAAAMAYTTANFTKAGRQAAEASRFQITQAEALKRRRVEEDAIAARDSFSGSIRMGMQHIGALGAGVMNRVDDFITGGTIVSAADRTGSMSGFTPYAALQALDKEQGRDELAVSLSSTARETAMGVFAGSGAAGMAVAGITAAAGLAISVPFAAPLMAVGAGLAVFGGAGLAADRLFGSTRHLTGAPAASVRTLRQVMDTTQATQLDRDYTGPAWKSLAAGKFKDPVELAEAVQLAASQEGVSAEQIVAGLKTTGRSGVLDPMNAVTVGRSPSQQKADADLLKSVIGPDANYTTADALGALKDAAASLDSSGNVSDVARSRLFRELYAGDASKEGKLNDTIRSMRQAHKEGKLSGAIDAAGRIHSAQGAKVGSAISDALKTSAIEAIQKTIDEGKFSAAAGKDLIEKMKTDASFNVASNSEQYRSWARTSNVDSIFGATRWSEEELQGMSQSQFEAATGVKAGDQYDKIRSEGGLRNSVIASRASTVASAREAGGKQSPEALLLKASEALSSAVGIINTWKK